MLVCWHNFAYVACMAGRQYIIRAVPAHIDRTLQRRAKDEKKSINTVAMEALARGLELSAKPVEQNLDDLIGSWQEDKAFDRAAADFRQVDEQIWK